MKQIRIKIKIGPPRSGVYLNCVQHRRFAHAVFACQQSHSSQTRYREFVDAAEVFDDQAGQVQGLVGWLFHWT